MIEELNNEELYDHAVEAAMRLFSNASVSRATARENPESLISEIETMLDTLGDPEED